MKRIFKSLLCLMCALCLSACSTVSSGTTSVNAPTLAPAQNTRPVPNDFSGMVAEQTVTLYLPSRDGQRLLAQYTTLQLDRTGNPEEAVVRALLSFPMNSEVMPLGMGVTVLGLYGQHPVEVSDGVCTVNLSSSLLQLEYSQQYTVCLALAATLSALGSVNYVNVLVANQPLSLDITGSLPAGSTAPHPGEELEVLWTQMDARRPELGQDPANQPLSAAATLYFPLADGTGFVSETRTLSFSGQSGSMLASGLLSALSTGAQYLSGTASMPDFSSLLAGEPVVEELADGGRRVHLYFVDNLTSRLELLGLDPVCTLGAVVYTLSTFLPAVSGIYLYSGGTPLTRLSNTFQTENGLVRRSDFSDLLMVQRQIRLCRNGKLTTVYGTLPWDLANDPASLLMLLASSPTQAQQAEGITSPLPDGLDETDILGMAMDGDCLVVNLSPRFERLLRQAGAEGEQLACYSMVNTLCDALSVRRVCFLFEGEMAETLGGTIYWGGEFLQNDLLSE